MRLCNKWATQPCAPQIRAITKFCQKQRHLSRHTQHWSAVTTEWFNPVHENLPMMQPALRDTAPEIDLTFIHKTTQANGSCFFWPRKCLQMISKPSDLIFRNHTSGEGFEHEFANSHELCNDFVTSWRLYWPTVARSLRKEFLKWWDQKAFSCKQLLLSSSKPSQLSDKLTPQLTLWRFKSLRGISQISISSNVLPLHGWLQINDPSFALPERKDLIHSMNNSISSYFFNLHIKTSI